MTMTSANDAVKEGSGPGPKFDAHVHIWERPWQSFIVGTGRSGKYDQRDVLLGLMNRNGVERACVLAACDSANPTNNEFVAEICRAKPERFVMLSEIPLLGERVSQLLDRTIEEWPAMGFRYMPGSEEMPDQWLTARHKSFWTKAEQAKLMVALNINPWQAAKLDGLIERYPGLTWLLDHMGRPKHNMTPSEFEPVLKLAKYNNVYIKISGFYAFTSKSTEYPYADLAKFVSRLTREFGAKRMLWGSDAPPVLDYSSYEQSYACLQSMGADLGEEDLSWILGRTAKALFSGPGKAVTTESKH